MAKKVSNKSRIIIAVFAALLLAGIILALAQHQSQKTAKVQSIKVHITDKAFTASTVVIKKGTVVTWVNDSEAPRIVASDPYKENTSLPSLKSKAFGQTDRYSYTFNQVGEFGYQDELHPTLHGKIIVQN